MQLERIKWFVVGGWMISAVILALVLRDLNWQIWAAFVALAVFPPLALLLWWNEPSQTMSESISEARRKTWPS